MNAEKAMGSGPDIQPPALLENLVKERPRGMPLAFDFFQRGHQDVLGENNAPCAVERPRHPGTRFFGALADENEDVDVTVQVRFSPRLGAEQDDFLRVELPHQIPGDLFDHFRGRPPLRVFFFGISSHTRLPIPFRQFGRSPTQARPDRIPKYQDGCPLAGGDGLLVLFGASQVHLLDCTIQSRSTQAGVEMSGRSDCHSDQFPNRHPLPY